MFRLISILFGSVLISNVFIVQSFAENAPQYHWRLFEDGGSDNKTYIDNSTKRQGSAFGTEQIVVLQDYKEISSAMMFGLSEIEIAEFDCIKSKFRSRSDTWFEQKMGEGTVAKRFPAIARWSAIPAYYIKLFASVCTP